PSLLNAGAGATLATAAMTVRTEGCPEPLDAPPSPRVLTLPLLLFLSGALGLVVVGWWQRDPRPDLLGGVRLLADGDLDGAERTRMLRRVLAQAATAPTLAGRWAGWLAAIALADRDAYQERLRALGGGDRPSEVPAPAECLFLDLGDPLLAAVLAAVTAEVGGDLATARAQWTSVQMQARLTAHVFARELATAALHRL
ncbi:MAG: hypothetical protein WAT39_25560, partial [Planctomycetota bacterium]